MKIKRFIFFQHWTNVFILGAKPDFALHWHLWNYQYARAYDDESRAFQYGFRDTIGDSFRWLDREAPADAPTSMKVPLTVSDLWGPPSIWVAQPSGTVTFSTKTLLF